MPMNVIFAGKTAILTKYEVGVFKDRVFVETSIINPLKNSPYTILPKHTLVSEDDLYRLQDTYLNYVCRGMTLTIPSYVEKQIVRLRKKIGWYQDSVMGMHPYVTGRQGMYTKSLERIYSYIEKGYNYIEDDKNINSILFSANNEKDICTIIRGDYVVTVETVLDMEYFTFVKIIVRIQERVTDRRPKTYYERTHTINILDAVLKRELTKATDIVVEEFSKYFGVEDKMFKLKSTEDADTTNPLDWGDAFAYTSNETVEEHRIRMMRLKDYLLQYDAKEITYSELEQQLKKEDYIKEKEVEPKLFTYSEGEEILRPTMMRIKNSINIMLNKNKVAELRYKNKLFLEKDTTFIDALMTK